MYLADVNPIDPALLPLGELKEHLRIATGFGDEALQDGVLGAVLRAAIVEIERATDKTLVQREFLLRLSEWS